MKAFILGCLLAAMLAVVWWLFRGNVLGPTSGPSSSTSPASASAQPGATIENAGRPEGRGSPSTETELAKPPVESTLRSESPAVPTAEATTGHAAPPKGIAPPEEETRWESEFGEASREELRSIVEKLSRVADEERERLFSDPALARQAIETSDRNDATLLQVESRFAAPGIAAVAARVGPPEKYGPVLFHVIRLPAEQAEVLAGLQRELNWLEAWMARR